MNEGREPLELGAGQPSAPPSATRPAETRRFCFLQGPHGSFFAELAAALRHLGHVTLRIGFNISDEAEWDEPGSYIAYTESLDAWPAAIRHLLEEHEISDLVLYGDARPYHRFAVEAAREAGLRIHFFEEGYLRPYWITYERDGVNGNSELMDIGLDGVDTDRLPDDPTSEIPPARWGELNSHVRHSVTYHIRNHFRNRRYPNLHRHLPNTPLQDWLYVAKRVFSWPIVQVRRSLRERAVLEGGNPYHLILLQLGWDASMRRHSSFSSVADFMDMCIEAFVAGAPPSDMVVFKTHPLEDGREGLERSAMASAAKHGLAADRVRFIEGGKLAALIERSKSVVTVNSTAAQQALWRGKPVKALGRAIFAKPGIVSDQPLSAFFAAPNPPDPVLYTTFRRFLLATSQIRGGYYRAEGRALVISPAVTAMLSAEGPYQRYLKPLNLATLRAGQGEGAPAEKVPGEEVSFEEVPSDALPSEEPPAENSQSGAAELTPSPVDPAPRAGRLHTPPR
ncbi:MAG: capsule biosynthesis protein CapA [Pseudomonadota bacterium]